ncbi:tRNA (guanosine(37)-N1)-methyltransferase TrmD [Candidatus Saganbacteria bacterium]|nr:tRNA (guanosine(37)-N1)-methyltransferase TrmD [Candidatus Saganbacteria bacterium]
MRVDILTLFPEMFSGPLSESLLKKAQERNLLKITLKDIRDFTTDKHQTADDSPYGGGPGMVLKVEPIFKAVKNCNPGTLTKIILMCPTGEKLTQEKAKELAQAEHLIVICGHYEGVDERVRKNLVTDEISIGDYVLTGGELPAMVLVDCLARLIPGVVKEGESVARDSFYNGLLDYPSYTKPEEFEGEKVPEVLRSGHHEEIEKWRRKETLKLTFFRRPELLAGAQLTDEDKKMLEEIVKNG